MPSLAFEKVPDRHQRSAALYGRGFLTEKKSGGLWFLRFAETFNAGVHLGPDITTALQAIQRGCDVLVQIFGRFDDGNSIFKAFNSRLVHSKAHSSGELSTFVRV